MQICGNPALFWSARSCPRMLRSLCTSDCIHTHAHTQTHTLTHTWSAVASAQPMHICGNPALFWSARSCPRMLRSLCTSDRIHTRTQNPAHHARPTTFKPSNHLPNLKTIPWHPAVYRYRYYRYMSQQKYWHDRQQCISVLNADNVQHGHKHLMSNRLLYTS